MSPSNLLNIRRVHPHPSAIASRDKDSRHETSRALVDRPCLNDVKNALLTFAGVIALLLGILGIVLPGLPTTPFVLLGAYCFARASPRLHAWLKRNRMFGSMIEDWEQNRSLPRRTKLIATVVMIGTVLLSIWQLADRLLLQLAIALLALIGSIVIWKIPTKPTPPDS